MDLGVHLPLIPFGSTLSLERLAAVTDAARECGFAALAANDHFVFRTPWLDGPTALASMVERSGELELATTLALVVLRGPAALAKALEALDVLSGGRVVAAVGPGSSAQDYELAGIPFAERWQRFDEALAALRERSSVPLWVGSWGSKAGLARVARAGDGWLASAYNTTPERFAAARADLAAALARRGRDADGFPNALSTMWTWVCDGRAEAERALADLAAVLGRDPEELRDRVCVGPPEHCARLLDQYVRAGCGRVYVWPLGDERRQLERLAALG